VKLGKPCLARRIEAPGSDLGQIVRILAPTVLGIRIKNFRATTTLVEVVMTGLPAMER
jgi:hypothetical protein